MKEPKPSTQRRLLAFRNDWTGLGPRGTDIIGGVGYYRITKPCQYLEQSGKYSVFAFGDLFACHDRLTKLGKQWDIDDMVPNLIRDSDCVLMKNISHPGGLAWFAGACDFYDRPLILDMDDNYMAVDDLHPRRSYFRPTETAQITHIELFKAATAMIVVNPNLVDVYKPYCKNIHVIPNYNDVTDWNYPKGKRKDGKVVIGWAGSLTHETDFRTIEPVMKSLWQKYGERITFSFCGAWPERLFKKFPANSYTITCGTRAMRDYPQALALWGFDIGIAPLRETVFNNGKGHAKWMEYAMYKTPTVASNVGPYKTTLEDGRTGFLVTTTDEWVDRISQLIDGPDLRARMGENAYQECVNKWQWKDHWQEWDDVFQQYHHFKP